MELTDLDLRISNLERQLAAARWRERAVYASAILIGLVFACKSSTATDDKPPPEPPKRLVIGGVTIDERGITITGIGAAITIEEKPGGDRSTWLNAGALRIGRYEGDAALIRLEAHGALARIEARTPAYRTTMSTTTETAEINVFKTGDEVHGAEMRLTGSDARIHASMNRHSASLIAAGADKAHAEVAARTADKSVGLTTAGGKPELKYVK